MPRRYQESKRRVSITNIYGRGKTQIPSEIRRYLSVDDDDKLMWSIVDDKVMVEKA